MDVFHQENFKFYNKFGRLDKFLHLKHSYFAVFELSPLSNPSRKYLHRKTQPKPNVTSMYVTNGKYFTLTKRTFKETKLIKKTRNKVCGAQSVVADTDSIFNFAPHGVKQCKITNAAVW